MLTAVQRHQVLAARGGSDGVIAQHSPDYFFAFNNALLEQPDVDSDGFTDTQLADLAIATGLDGPKVVRSCIEQSYASWAKTARRPSGRSRSFYGTDGVALTGTPMVLVNGTQYVGALDDPKEFAQFALTVASDTYNTVDTRTNPDGDAHLIGSRRTSVDWALCRLGAIGSAPYL